MSACAGCGAALPANPGKKPFKWCSERCRKAQYGGTCEVCGARTDGSYGRDKAPKRCAVHVENGRSNPGSGPAVQHEEGRERRELFMSLWAEGLTQTQIAERLGTTRNTIASYISRLRGYGYEIPYRRTPAQRAAITSGRWGNVRETTAEVAPATVGAARGRANEGIASMDHHRTDGANGASS